MADSTIRSDAVNVEQIMEQIRARIREKRGVDYTDQQMRELAKAKLEQLLDPRSLHSDLLDQFKKLQPAYQPPRLSSYDFEDSTMFESHRWPLRFIRRLLQPILKLFFNPNPLIHALHTQAQLNGIYAEREAKREAMRLAGEQLYFERLHQLVIDMTRTGLELQNLRMRVESLGSRVEFNERRARTLESAVMYTPADETSGRGSRGHSQAPAPGARQPQPAVTETGEPSSSPMPVGMPGQAAAPAGEGHRNRRRRRRRGRRRGGGASATAGEQPEQAAVADAPGTVARNDLETFTGAASHRSEPDEPQGSVQPAGLERDPGPPGDHQ